MVKQTRQRCGSSQHTCIANRWRNDRKTTAMREKTTKHTTFNSQSTYVSCYSVLSFVGPESFGVDFDPSWTVHSPKLEVVFHRLEVGVSFYCLYFISYAYAHAQVLNFMPAAMVVVCYYSCHHFLSLSSPSFAAMVFCMCLQLVSLSFIRVIAFHDRSVVSGWLADWLALAGVRIDHRSFPLELLQASPARPLPLSTVSCENYIQETNKFNSQSRITTARNWNDCSDASILDLYKATSSHINIHND